MYVIEENLNSSKQDKMISAGVSAIVMSLFLLLLMFIRISQPDPPIVSKQGVLELDFGYVDGGFGEPDQGGPSETPPAKGGEIGGSNTTVNSSAPPPSSILTTTKGARVKNLPTIKTSTSDGTTTTPKTDSRLSKLKSRTAGDGNASTDGNPKGWDGGRGTAGSGDGANSGIQGDGGDRQGARGTGGVYAPFKNFTVSTRTVKITADGRGKIRYTVRVNCDGSYEILGSYLGGTTYTGRATDANFKTVFARAMQGVRFTKIGDNCPEERAVTADIQPE